MALTSINGRNSQSLRVRLPVLVLHLSIDVNSETLPPDVSGISSRFLCADESRLILSFTMRGASFSMSLMELN